jgi:hypothetical protein
MKRFLIFLLPMFVCAMDDSSQVATYFEESISGGGFRRLTFDDAKQRHKDYKRYVFNNIIEDKVPGAKVEHHTAVVIVPLCGSADHANIKGRLWLYLTETLNYPVSKPCNRARLIK